MTGSPRILEVGDEPPPIQIRPQPPKPQTPRNPPSKAREPAQGPGRFQIINTFVDTKMASLRRADIAVWIVLWRDTKQDGLVKTSQADLARRAGCDNRSVRRSLRRLEQQGLLIVVRKGGLNTGPSTYRVLAGTDSS
jgi:predicted transcriptional regulator